MNLTWKRSFALMAVVIWLASAPVRPASAHPHVWVTAKADVVYEGGKIAAIQHHWTFDEFYTAMAIQGLDKNNDGIYSREELAELAKVNMEGLKEFDYFTSAKIADKKVEFNAPADAWLEHKDGLLTLHFKLPLTQPVAAEAKGFQFAVYDPSYFIAFEFAKDNAITLAGAPAGCKVVMGEVAETPDEKALSSAMSQQMGGMGLGTGTTKAAAVACGNS